MGAVPPAGMAPSWRSAWAWGPPAACLALLAAILASAGNQALFLWLNHAMQRLDMRVWLHLTMFGDGAVALALVLPWIRRAPRRFRAALVAAVVAGLWTQVAKQCVDVPRPLAVLAAGEFVQAGPPYRQVSFPSGHAATVFALAGVWVMGWRPGPAPSWVTAWRILLLAFACAVALSRIAVGVHWPVDLLWGMLGGWGGAWLGFALQERRRPGGGRVQDRGPGGVGGLLAGSVLALLAAALLVSRHIGIPEILPAQRLVGAACLGWGLREMALLYLPPAWLARLARRSRAPGLLSRRMGNMEEE